MATLKDNIVRAVSEMNYINAGRIADKLRFKYGMNYKQVLEFFQRCVPSLTEAEFDQLMYAVDTREL